MSFQLCLGRLRVLNMFRFTLVRYISSLPTTSRERNRVRILDVTNGAPITVLCMIRCSILIGRMGGARDLIDFAHRSLSHMRARLQ